MPLLAELGERPPPLREALTGLVTAMAELHRHRPALHRVLFEEAPRPARLRARLEQVQQGAVTAVADYLRQADEVETADPLLAAQLVVTVVEATTHTLVIHPDGERDADVYVHETVALLNAYLTGGG